FASALPVHCVTRMCLFYDESFADDGDRLEWFFREWTSILADPPADSPDAGMHWDAHSAAGFVVALGKGSEAAPVGFLRGHDDTGTRRMVLACVREDAVRARRQRGAPRQLPHSPGLDP